MITSSTAYRSLRGLCGILFFAGAWEAFSRSGIFPEGIVPNLETIGLSFVVMLRDGSIVVHIAYTLERVLIGLAIASVMSVPIGMLMGRSWVAERFFKGPLSVLMPVPSLAWVPVFILWFGVGNKTTIFVVAYAAAFPMIYNVWLGVRAMNPLWIRSAVGMGADTKTVFWRVLIPASFPFVLTGLRQSFGRAWIAVIGAELLAGTDYGLGRLIFEAKEWLSTDAMLAAIGVIGLIGLVAEKIVFETIDRHTVIRWGMARSTDPAT
jgi:NitT/TauT family transport system permease protein